MSSPAKQKKAAKPKTPATHPKYNEMVIKAISTLKERGGSSRQAILKYVMANFNVGNDATPVNARVKTALKRGVVAGALKQTKGTGASGSFRLGEKPAAPKKKAVKKPKVAKKPKAKKPAGDGAASKTKKAKSPKKAKAVKSKPKAKTPKKTKAAAKPKKTKTPQKAAKPKAKKSPKKAAKKPAKK